jgi:hypothetical protein
MKRNIPAAVMETKIVDVIDPSNPKVEMKPKKAHSWIILYDKI